MKDLHFYEHSAMKR